MLFMERLGKVRRKTSIDANRKARHGVEVKILAKLCCLGKYRIFT